VRQREEHAVESGQLFRLEGLETTAEEVPFAWIELFPAPTGGAGSADRLERYVRMDREKGDELGAGVSGGSYDCGANHATDSLLRLEEGAGRSA
jgi:hypothetical protein